MHKRLHRRRRKASISRDQPWWRWSSRRVTHRRVHTRTKGNASLRPYTTATCGIEGHHVAESTPGKLSPALARAVNRHQMRDSSPSVEARASWPRHQEESEQGRNTTAKPLVPQPNHAPKRCPQEGARHKAPPSPDPVEPDRGFPLEHSRWNTRPPSTTPSRR